LKKFAGKSKNDPYKMVVRAMKTESGKLVQGPDFGLKEMKPMATRIEKVAILTDKGCASAAESFILHSKGMSNRVTVFGEPTSGTIDYNNINMLPLGCEKHGIQFGYPMFSWNANTVENGYNKTGILPDVKIDANQKDKIGFILEYLNKN
jgi:C-terminal processing protease CtpA/Prc